ncbi:MAG: dynamin family protein [Polyangiaceae bacterium]|nr:dynamin family protein [Polyangiaceae bacterium]
MLDAFNDKRKTVLDALRKLTDIAGDIGSASAREQIQKTVVDKLEDNVFHLVVVGEFNHGKTTFVNALLGAHILPIGVTPTTAVIHEIEYDENPHACVVYESGEKREIPFDEVKKFAIGNTAQPDPPPEGPVRALKIGYPANLLRKHIALVDTPGVNDLSFARAEITYEYIPRSDAVLFLLDAGQLVKESERVFLKDKLLGQSRDRIVFVVTKNDILAADDTKQAMDYVQTQLEKIVEKPRVFSVSADRCLKGLREQSGMDDLLAFLSKFLSEERGNIMLDNALGDGTRACSLLEKGVDAKLRALNMNTDEIDRRINAIEEDLDSERITIEKRRAEIREGVAAIKAWAQRDLDRFVKDVCDQLPGIIDSSDIGDLKAHLGTFLERTLRDWAHRETAEIGEALEKLAEKTTALVRQDARNTGVRLAEKMGADMTSPVIEIDTVVFDIGTAALFGAGAMTVLLLNSWWIGGILVVAAPVLAYYSRGYAQSQSRKKAKELGPIAIHEAAEKVGPKLQHMIDEFARALDAWVATASEEVHRALLDVLVTARREKKRGEAACAMSTAECRRQEAKLGQVKIQLESMRAELKRKPA